MKCAWDAYLRILPPGIREEVDRIGRDTLLELRLRTGRPPELVMIRGSCFLQHTITEADMEFCVNTASKYSPWSAATVSDGYITAPGGHRIGICGDTLMQNGKISTVRYVTSLCIRVARDFQGIAHQSCRIFGSTLIIGRPGSGKTTLLRDFIRQKSNHEHCCVGVVDERLELFPMCDQKFCFSPGLRTEVISGCSKSAGIGILIRTMNPQWVAVDEITAAEDCQALIQACFCGVTIMATAHAENMSDFAKRLVYRPLIESGVFQNYIVMQQDRSWKIEELNKCV